jgi:SagB-type dehydrogenase family enzyme
VLPLDLVEVGPDPRYEAAFTPGLIAPAPLDRLSICRLFHDALALSAWKQAGTARWALRVNPSSGNLHPTEGYLVAGPIAGLHPRPAVFHYAPLEHALELRAELSENAWRKIASQLPEGAVLVGLTSIHWRESWKYGERAFRYCHHDVGHAIGAVAVSAAGLGWETRLLESVIDAELAVLLGVHTQAGVEAEHADCLMAVFAQGASFAIDAQRRFAIPGTVSDEIRDARWSGAPNRLSRDHHPWPVIDEVAAATEKRLPPGEAFWFTGALERPSLEVSDSALALRHIIHQRRSALALDGRTSLTRSVFYQILSKVMPGSRQIPFTTLPWRPSVDLLLFVHRVADLTPGLYILLRDPARREALDRAMEGPLSWTRAEGCPTSLPLFLLASGDARRAAQQTSCDQEIAADGVFAAAMLAEYRAPLDAFGPWHYRRLYWETGVIGQVLYLEAEASGLRGTGIGCFFDDLTHQVFGLTGDRLQVLYHFTMGAPVDDPRLQTHPPYQRLARAAGRDGPGEGRPWQE